jgi:hypothetical protein
MTLIRRISSAASPTSEDWDRNRPMTSSGLSSAADSSNRSTAAVTAVPSKVHV